MPWATICSASQILDWPLIYDHKGDPYTITLTHHVPGKRGLTHWGILETFSTVISTTLVSFSGGSTKLPSLGIRNWVGPKPRIYPHLLKRSKVHKAGPKLTSRQLWQVHRGLPHLNQDFELTWKDTTIILGPIPTRSARQWILEAAQRFRDNLDTYYGLQYLPR